MKTVKTLIVAALVIFPAFVFAEEAPPATAAPPWQWFGSCARSTGIDLDVTLDDATVWHKAIPICRTEMEDPTVLTFKFTSPRPMRWIGCCISGDIATPKGRNIDGYIHFSGGASDLILVVTFVDRNIQLLRTMHISDSNSGHTSSFGNGITIKTSAVHTIDVPSCTKADIFQNPVDGKTYCMPGGWQAFGPEGHGKPQREKVALGDVRLLQNEYVIAAHTDVADLVSIIRLSTAAASEVFANCKKAATVYVQFTFTPGEKLVEMASEGDPPQDLLQTYFGRLKQMQPLKVTGEVKFQFTIKVKGPTSIFWQPHPTPAGGVITPYVEQPPQ
jgi:hypothetical protein